ncbi:MAG: fibronectin type III domain-containing protein, partial [Christensenellaceae bacterium]|nr:fibronectin type III domain-containing protein [Christensenellaceae bacterium]
VPGATGYGIYRYDAASKTYKYYTATKSLTYTNTGLTTNATYYYKIRAYRTVNGSNIFGAYSAAVSAKPIPAAPSITVANAGSRKIKIGWNKIAGASGYEVLRSTSASGTYSIVKTVTSGSTVSFTNTGLTKGKTYYYKVRAYRTVSGKKVYGNYSAVKYAKG